MDYVLMRRCLDEADLYALMQDGRPQYVNARHQAAVFNEKMVYIVKRQLEELTSNPHDVIPYTQAPKR